MSLGECPDCGESLSSSARACPHCGRPSKKARLPIELVGGLGFAVFSIIALSWHSTWQDDTASASVTPETVIARPYRHLEQSLNASIGYNRTLYLFRVENRDAFPWTHCLLSLNSRGISGYELEVTSINPGLTDAALLQSSEFVDADGRKFDPSTDTVATLDLDCESPHGHLFYGGKFGTQHSASHYPPKDEARREAIELVSRPDLRQLQLTDQDQVAAAGHPGAARDFSAVSLQRVRTLTQISKLSSRSAERAPRAV